MKRNRRHAHPTVEPIEWESFVASSSGLLAVSRLSFFLFLFYDFFIFFIICFLENFCLRQCLLHTDTTGEYIFFSFSLDILFFLIFLLFRPLPSLFRSFKRCIYNNLLILLFFRFFHFCTWFEIHNSNLYVFLSVLSFTATPVGKPNTNTQYMPLSLCILMSDWFFFFEYFSHQRGRDDDGDDVWPFCRASTFQILLIFRLFFFHTAALV